MSRAFDHWDGREDIFSCKKTAKVAVETSREDYCSYLREDWKVYEKWRP